jgi:hypothetical protein
MRSSFRLNSFLGNTSVIIYLFIIFFSAVFLTGCASTPTFIKSDFDQKHIKSIAIMPVTDNRIIVSDSATANENILNIEGLLSEKIMDKNYDVLSPGSLKTILTEKANENLSPENLCSELKVDGVLFSELFEYTDKFFIHHSINMRFKIYDAKGDSLWINDLDDSDRPFLSAIGTSLGWAIGVAVDNKLSSKNKLPTIFAGVAAAEVVYLVVDGIRNETSESIDKTFDSLPDAKGSIK